MIIGGNREEVIENIKRCVENGDFHGKVETGDPSPTSEEEKRIIETYLENRRLLTYRFKRKFAVSAARIVTKAVNSNTLIEGLENIPEGLGGVIITSNHFSPFENTVIRFLTDTMGRKNLAIITQVSNFAMDGVLGFLMNYADTVPISTEPRYLAGGFTSVMRERLVENKDAVLLYPEQEMWFNYRKPRPPQSGAYFFASKLGVPILSCFVEICDTDKDEKNADFKKVRYILHVLGVLYPDPDESVRVNTERLANADYEMKKECYEKVYGKKLTYKFEPCDIAGWKKGYEKEQSALL